MRPSLRPAIKVILFGLLVFISFRVSDAERKREKIYTNGWAVKVSGGIGKAKIVAKQHGFEKVEKVCECCDENTLTTGYCLIYQKSPTYSRRFDIQLEIGAFLTQKRYI